MPTFKIRSIATTYYEHTVEADNIGEAIYLVEDGGDEGVEYDSTDPAATQYAVEGVMGWNDVEDE